MRILVLGGVSLVFFVVLLATFGIVPVVYNSEKLTAGTFGDMFGAANAFFSGLAFLGVVYALLLQHEEMKGQHLASRKREFEGTFFELLKQFNQTTGSIKIHKTKVVSSSRTGSLRDMTSQTLLVEITGRNCFKVFLDGFLETYRTTDNADTLIDCWNHHYDNSEVSADLGHYFRMLYNLIKYADEHALENKKHYVDLIRSQLSRYELAILAFNALGDRGRTKMLPLMRDYNMFKHLKKEDVKFDGIYDQLFTS